MSPTRRRRASTDSKLAVAYIRVSTEDQNLGPEAQRTAIERWAASHGVTVVSWHVDQGVSGACPVEDRSGLLDALTSLHDHRAGLLLAAKRDRLARDVVVAATIERLVLLERARVVTADGVSAEDTPEGALMRTLLDAFAAYERAVIRARTRAALAVKRARGERISGRAPLGFRFEGGRLVEEPSEQALLACVRDLRSGGASFREVVEQLNASGVTIRGGRVWETTLVRALRHRSSSGSASTTTAA